MQSRDPVFPRCASGPHKIFKTLLPVGRRVGLSKNKKAHPLFPKGWAIAKQLGLPYYGNFSDHAPSPWVAA